MYPCDAMADPTLNDQPPHQRTGTTEWSSWSVRADRRGGRTDPTAPDQEADPGAASMGFDRGVKPPRGTPRPAAIALVVISDGVMTLCPDRRTSTGGQPCPPFDPHPGDVASGDRGRGDGAGDDDIVLADLDALDEAEHGGADHDRDHGECCDQVDGPRCGLDHPGAHHDHGRGGGHAEAEDPRPGPDHDVRRRPCCFRAHRHGESVRLVDRRGGPIHARAPAPEGTGARWMRGRSAGGLGQVAGLGQAVLVGGLLGDDEAVLVLGRGGREGHDAAALERLGERGEGLVGVGAGRGVLVEEGQEGAGVLGDEADLAALDAPGSRSRGCRP